MFFCIFSNYKIIYFQKTPCETHNKDIENFFLILKNVFIHTHFFVSLLKINFPRHLELICWSSKSNLYL